MDAPGHDVGHVEATVGADLEAIRNRIVAGQASEILDLAIWSDAAHASRVGFVPDDRTVRLDGHAIGKYRGGKRDDNARSAVGRDAVDVAWVGIFRVVDAGIGEDQAAIRRAKARSLGPLSLTPRTSVIRASALPPARTV
jgi:hypothetical protein